MADRQVPTHATTPAELRRLVEAARRDLHVTSFRYTSIRAMVGDEPTQCPAGHPYELRREAGRLVSEDWVPCSCGGHHVKICFVGGCPSPRLADPVVAYDCDADPQHTGIG
jgi:hypothetical protein